MGEIAKKREKRKDRISWLTLYRLGHKEEGTSQSPKEGEGSSIVRRYSLKKEKWGGGGGVTDQAGDCDI